MKKLFNLLLAAVFLLAFLAERQPIQASPSPIDSAQAWANKVEPDVQVSLDQLQSSDMLSVIITMADQADLSQIPGVGLPACRVSSAPCKPKHKLLRFRSGPF